MEKTEMEKLEIVIMGCTGSGKTSIKKVVFEKLSPYESVFIEPTNKIESFTNEQMGFLGITVTEYPGSFSPEKASPEDLKYFDTCEMIIYVLDSQDNSNNPFEDFKAKVLPQLIKNPEIEVSVFIHKIDSVNMYKGENSKQIGEVNNKFKDIFTKANLDIVPTFYSTSIYDYSLFESFSKIFQKMIHQNVQLSLLLDEMSLKCKFSKAYLFDVFNKIYLALDQFPLEKSCFEICSDMIDVVLDMSGIYGEENNNESYFDDNSSSVIRITDVETHENSVLYLRFIDSNFALICLITEAEFERPHLLDYNIKMFRDAVKKIRNKED
ncbi:MAG: Rag family GTP-binding protein [archaeon]|nr:Rag family GTP-binding protein [archaeon]